MRDANRCVVCGEIVPEGRQVCPRCERRYLHHSKHNLVHFFDVTLSIILIFIIIIFVLCCTAEAACVDNAVRVDDVADTNIFYIDQTDVDMLAQLVWGEARGCTDKGMECVVWCVLNRADTFNVEIKKVILEPLQFAGYNADNPIDEHIREVVTWVLVKHYRGYAGAIPRDFLYFSGDGVANYFRNGNGEVIRVE